MSYLVLDLAHPGSDPQKLVSVARSFGAQGVAGYLRNWPEWTPAMVRAVLDAGLGFLPIELYDGQAPQDTLPALAGWGLSACPVALDVEAGSWPADSWQQSWEIILDGHGFTSVGYSQASVAVPYRKRWYARYTWPGQPDQQTVYPIESAPPGEAVQYAHAILVDGLDLDVSSFDFPILEDPMALNYSAKLGLTALAYYAVLGRGPANQPEVDQWAVQIGDDGSNLWQIVEAIAASAEGVAYATPAAHIADLQARVKTVSGEVGILVPHTHTEQGSTGPAVPTP